MSQEIVQLAQLQGLYYSPDPEQVAQAEELLRSLEGHEVEVLFWQHHTSRQLTGRYTAQREAAERLKARPDLRRADLRSQLYGVIVGYMARADLKNADRERGAALLRAGLADPKLAQRFWKGCAADGVLHSAPEALYWLDREALLIEIVEALPAAERARIHTIRGPGYRWHFPPPARLLAALPNVTALDLEDVAPSRRAEDYPRLSAIQTLRLTLRYGLPPAGLGRMTALESLDLSQSEGLRALPGDLGQCPRLQRIDARGCAGLTEVGGGLGQAPALEVLRLDGAKALTALPEELGASPRLRRLGLAGCGRLRNIPTALDGVEIDITGCTSLTSGPPSLLRTLFTSDHAVALVALKETSSLAAPARKKVATRIRALLKSKLWAEVCVALDSLNRFDDPALNALIEKGLFTEIRKRLRGRDGSRFEQGLDMLRRLSSPAALLALWQDSDPADPETLGAELRGLRGARPVKAAWAMVGMLPLEHAAAITALSPAIFPERPDDADWSALGRLSGLRTLRHRDFPDRPDVARGLRALRELSLHGDLKDGLPDALAELPSLERLVIERAYLMHAVPAVLGRLAGLRVLELQSCSNLAAGGDVIAEMAGLEVLQLHRTPLSIPSVAGMPRLRELRLDFTAQEAPPEGLLTHPTVEVLGTNALGGGSAEARPSRDLLLTSLPELSGMPSLRQLELKQHSALTSLPALPALDVLDVQGCAGLQALPASLARRPLRLLDIRWTGITALPEGIAFAAGGTLRLERQQLLSLLSVVDACAGTLAEVDVGGRRVVFGASPAEVVGELLSLLPDVPVLDLRSMRRLVVGVETLDLSALRYKAKLETLDVSGWTGLRHVHASGGLPRSMNSLIATGCPLSSESRVWLSQKEVAVTN